jgi:hypothetical protein
MMMDSPDQNNHHYEDVTNGNTNGITDDQQPGQQ